MQACTQALVYLHVSMHMDGLVGVAVPTHTRVSGVQVYFLIVCVCELEHLPLQLEVVLKAGTLAYLHTGVCSCVGAQECTSPPGSVLLSPPPARVPRGRPREPRSYRSFPAESSSAPASSETQQKSSFEGGKIATFIP